MPPISRFSAVLIAAALLAGCQSRKAQQPSTAAVPAVPAVPSAPQVSSPKSDAPQAPGKAPAAPGKPSAPALPATGSLPAMPADDVHSPAAIAAAQAKVGRPTQATSQLRGRVLERLEASPYCYLRLKTEKGEVWAAVPQAKAEKGAEVTVENPMLMKDFESKSLGRTFPEVYFGALTETDVQGQTAARGPRNPHEQGSKPSVAAEPVKVERAAGLYGRTIAEVWAQRAKLAGKTVLVRGKIVKYNEGVMGKNWIHLQDGSGQAAKGTHDLTATTSDTASKGDVVTLQGTVRLNRDFGAGYSYELILEDARIQKSL